MIIKGDSELLPLEVKQLLRGLSLANFFTIGILCGSWAMAVYKLYYRLLYALRTDDIDFAVDLARHAKADIPDILLKLGYLPIMDMSGIEKYVRGTFSIEFIVQRKGGKDAPFVAIKEMKIRALPLPFVSMLFIDPITVDFGDFGIRVPSVESEFLHKLIIAQRRKTPSKTLKDLEQCASLIPVIDSEKLTALANTQRFSKNTKAHILKSANEIIYPQFLR